MSALEIPRSVTPGLPLLVQKGRGLPGEESVLSDSWVQVTPRCWSRHLCLGNRAQPKSILLSHAQLSCLDEFVVRALIFSDFAVYLRG